MKKIIIITLLLNFVISIASAAEKKVNDEKILKEKEKQLQDEERLEKERIETEKKDCSVHKKLIDKMKCKTANAVKPKGFFKKTIDKTIDYQKKAFDKKD